MTVLYDPVGLDDNFGKVMINNLNVGPSKAVFIRLRAHLKILLWQARGLQLYGLPCNVSIAQLAQRLRDFGFPEANSKDVSRIRKEDVPKDEQER